MNPTMFRFNQQALMAPEGADGGGDEPRKQNTYTYEYVRELREEAKSYRERLRDTQKELEELRPLKDRVAEFDKVRDAAVAEAVNAVKTQSNQKLLKVRLEAAAVAAGLVDLDGIKILDTSKIKISDDGEVKIPEGFFEEAKASKPYLFKSDTGAEKGTSSNTDAPPKPAVNEGLKKVKDMTSDELVAFERSIGLRR